MANATSMTLSDGTNTLATGPLPSGSIETGPLNATTTFTLTALGGGAQAQSTVVVTASANLPTVQLTATPNPVQSGQFTTFSWTTTNASTISFDPEIEIEDVDPLPLSFSTSLALQSTTTYTATVTGQGGTTTGSITITVLPPAPSITFAANPSAVVVGGNTTLTWNVQDATALSIADGSNNVVVPSGALPSGSQAVTPAASTTYTATATGAGGTQTATAAVTVANLVANPSSINIGQTSTLSWNFPGATSVSISPCNLQNVPDCSALPPASSAVTQPLNSTTKYTATPTGGSAPAASVTVTVSGLKSRLKHIIFFMQENRSFDQYFGRLGAYRAQKVPGASPSDIDGFDPNVELTGLQGRKVSPFHSRTVCTDNLSPSWNETHSSIHLRNGTYLMDRFMLATASIPEGLQRDPNGDRAMGFYDERDLPYYYELATQFATSDRWFAPLLTHTIPNRMYLFAATSFGHIRASDPAHPRPDTGWPVKTIFDLLTEHNIPWKYYYQDSSVFLSDWAAWNNPVNQGRVRNISEWFSILSNPNADQLLPPVVFIERGGNPDPKKGQVATDEHPLNNIQVGAKVTRQIIDALMKSSAWQSSAFIWTFDEAGGLYDHVPPVPMPKPDDIEPFLRSTDVVDQFDKSGLRVPLIVVSPWVKKNYVSHTPRDFTAILNFIQERFDLPALTRRDAAQPSMQEFFDFSTPSWLTPPPLPEQPAHEPILNWNDPGAGVCDFRLETAP